MLSFYKQQSYFSQIVSKKAKITILFWVLVFSFMYLVSVYPTNRTIVAIGQKINLQKTTTTKLLQFEAAQQSWHSPKTTSRFKVDHSPRKVNITHDHLGCSKSLQLGSKGRQFFIYELLEYSLINLQQNIKTVYQNLRLTKIRFTTISSRFFANYFYIFHKTEVQTVILRC